MRAASKDDFVVKVDGIGDFVFGHRTMADHIKVNVEHSRMVEGVTPTPFLDTLAGWIATIRVLAVRTPGDFDLDALDPLEESTYDKLMQINGALRAKELSFRGKQNPASEGSGTATGGKP